MRRLLKVFFGTTRRIVLSVVIIGVLVVLSLTIPGAVKRISVRFGESSAAKPPTTTPSPRNLKILIVNDYSPEKTSREMPQETTAIPTPVFAPLSLSLQSNYGGETAVPGTTDVRGLGVNVMSNLANRGAVTISSITLRAYSSEYNPDDVIANIRLYRDDAVLSLAPTSNLLKANGTVTFSGFSVDINPGQTTNLSVVFDLKSGAEVGGDISFDIADINGKSGADLITPNACPNGCNDASVTTHIINRGSIAATLSATSPPSQTVSWGQSDALFSAFDITSAADGFFIERLTIGPGTFSEQASAAANILTIKLVYPNRQGLIVSASALPDSRGIANFVWTDATQPYIPKDSRTTIKALADMKKGVDGATNAIFSLDLLPTYLGSPSDGFRAVGQGNGSVLDGSSIASVSGSKMTVQNDAVESSNQSFFGAILRFFFR